MARNAAGRLARLGLRPYHAALAVLLATGAVGVWVSPDRALSTWRFGALAAGLGVYALTRWGVNSPGRFGRALWALPAVGLALAALGFSGTFWLTYKLPFTQGLVDDLPRLPESWLALAGSPAGLHPNLMSALANWALLPLAGMALFALRAPLGRDEKRLALAAAAVGVVLLAYLALAVSRGALLALWAAGTWLLYRRQARLGVLSALAGLLALGAAALLAPGLAGNLLFSDLLTPETYPGSSRLEIWPFGLRLLAAAPLTGIGLGTFPLYARAAGLGAPETITHGHNLALQAALDLGVPGALAYLGLLIEAGTRAARGGARLGRGLAAGAAHGLAAAVLAFGVFGLADAVTVTARAGVVVWLGLGLAAAAGDQGQGDQAERSG